VLVHRQLAAAISYCPLHATLHSKTHVERALDVVNKRHRMAQMAGRASIEFYVGLALKARAEKSASLGVGKVREEAFVIRTFRNGLNVFVSKLVLLLVCLVGTKVNVDPILQAWNRRFDHVQTRDEVRRD
jgi:exosome complex exonuclease DIS3/RRP44